MKIRKKFGGLGENCTYPRIYSAENVLTVITAANELATRNEMPPRIVTCFTSLTQDSTYDDRAPGHVPRATPVDTRLITITAVTREEAEGGGGGREGGRGGAPQVRKPHTPGKGCAHVCQPSPFPRLNKTYDFDTRYQQI